MPKLRVLSSAEIIKILGKFDFVIVSQKGSHIKLKRTVNFGIKQSLTVPNHHELDRGTTKAIYNQAARYIPVERLREYFFHSK